MSREKSNSLKSLFEPGNFAVIGASRDEKKIGHAIVRNLVKGGFKGGIYPVSPKSGEILGMKVYSDIREIEDEIDMVSICVPSKLCLEAVRQCSEKRVRNIQIITSGFSEVGNNRDEEEMVAVAKSAGSRILGPNIFGMYCAASSMNSTFSATGIKPGTVAILTQSGALGIAMIGKTAVENMGLSAIVSLGNKSDIDEADLLEYLIDDSSTKVIMMYIEGVKKGERLIRMIKRTTKEKPVIVIKSGKSKRGAMAAASHTGSLAGSDRIFDSVMKQLGVLRADTLESAFDWAKFLSISPEPGGDSSVIVTNGGGIGVLATDACEKYGIDLYDNQDVLKSVFGPVTPSFGSTKNPVDITGGAMAGDYRTALSAPALSGEMKSTIALYCETATFDSENLAPMIRETFERHLAANKPIAYAAVGGESVEKAMAMLRRENVPVFSDVEPAVSCLGAAYRFYRYRREPIEPYLKPEIDNGRINEIVDSVIAGGRNSLLAAEGREVMVAAGINVPKSGIAKNIGDAVDLAESIGYPVVMKVVSRDILHKSDAGGIALDLENREDVMHAFEAIIHNCRSYRPDALIEGVELAEMAQKGVEMVVGAIRDASFGPVVMCGLGGIYVEVMKDVSFRSFPLSVNETMGMVRELRSFPLLLGVRGEKRKDIEGVADTIIKLGAILKACDRITDMEINPLVVYEQNSGLKALDVRILVKNPKEDRT